MNDEKLLVYMESIDNRLSAVESSIVTINHELGKLAERVKPTLAPMLIKFVVFPLILVIGGIIGVKVFLPF